MLSKSVAFVASMLLFACVFSGDDPRKSSNYVPQSSDTWFNQTMKLIAIVETSDSLQAAVAFVLHRLDIQLMICTLTGLTKIMEDSVTPFCVFAKKLNRLENSDVITQLHTWSVNASLAVLPWVLLNVCPSAATLMFLACITWLWKSLIFSLEDLGRWMLKTQWMLTFQIVTVFWLHFLPASHFKLMIQVNFFLYVSQLGVVVSCIRFWIRFLVFEIVVHVPNLFIRWSFVPVFKLLKKFFIIPEYGMCFVIIRRWLMLLRHVLHLVHTVVIISVLAVRYWILNPRDLEWIVHELIIISIGIWKETSLLFGWNSAHAKFSMFRTSLFDWIDWSQSTTSGVFTVRVLKLLYLVVRLIRLLILPFLLILDSTEYFTSPLMFLLGTVYSTRYAILVIVGYLTFLMKTLLFLTVILPWFIFISLVWFPLKFLGLMVSCLKRFILKILVMCIGFITCVVGFMLCCLYQPKREKLVEQSEFHPENDQQFYSNVMSTQYQVLASSSLDSISSYHSCVDETSSVMSSQSDITVCESTFSDSDSEDTLVSSDSESDTRSRRDTLGCDGSDNTDISDSEDGWSDDRFDHTIIEIPDDCSSQEELRLNEDPLYNKIENDDKHQDDSHKPTTLNNHSKQSLNLDLDIHTFVTDQEPGSIVTDENNNFYSKLRSELQETESLPDSPRSTGYGVFCSSSCDTIASEIHKPAIINELTDNQEQVEEQISYIEILSKQTDRHLYRGCKVSDLRFPNEAEAKWFHDNFFIWGPGHPDYIPRKVATCSDICKYHMESIGLYGPDHDRALRNIPHLLIADVLLMTNLTDVVDVGMVGGVMEADCYIWNRWFPKADPPPPPPRPIDPNQPVEYIYY